MRRSHFFGRYRLYLLILLYFLLTMSSLHAASLKIIPPNLKLAKNKISAANAEMPDLIFKVKASGISLPQSAQYKWWLRVQYNTDQLGLPRDLATVGCAGSASSKPTSVWGLPAGDVKQLCLRDMTSRKVWITTKGPILHLGQPIRIQEADGTSHEVLMKNKFSAPEKHKGILLYGGGQLEVEAKVEFTTPQGKPQSLIARYPANIKAPKVSGHLTGLNPSRSETKKFYVKVSKALYTDDPTKEQKKIRKRVAGDLKFHPIPKTLYEILPTLFDVIACRETRRAQFCRQNFCIGIERIVGFPIVSFDGGYGMYQLTNPRPNYYEKWSWTESLLDTAERLYPHIKTTQHLAAALPDKAQKRRVYFRELFARHNASNVGYFEHDGSRQPIICKEPVAFKHNAPNTSPFYRKSLIGNTALLQALKHSGGGANLADSKIAACNGGGYDRNAGRRIVGKYTPPNDYQIESVGNCFNSSICYVDVDTLYHQIPKKGCFSPYIRRNF